MAERDLTVPNAQDEADPARLTQTFLEQVNVNLKFRVVADFLRTVRYLHIVPQLVREPERSVGKSNDPYGGDFIEQIARTPERTRNARLRRILQALTIAVPQLEKLELDQDVRGAHHLRREGMCTGALRAPGSPRRTSRMAHCASWVSCGQSLNGVVRCCWRSLSCRCILLLFGTCHKCSAGCSPGRAAKCL